MEMFSVSISLAVFFMCIWQTNFSAYYKNYKLEEKNSKELK